MLPIRMLEKVLLPIDFSDMSMRMFECALDLKELGSKNLILFHVVPKGQNISSDNKRKLQELEERLMDAGMHTDAIVKYGDPVEQIISEADMEHVDMIAMASGGKSRTEAFFVGSVSFGIIRRSNKPILLDKFPEDEAGKSRECRLGQHLFRNALITIDLPACSPKVEEMFDTLCVKGLSKATLLHIIDSSQYKLEDDDHFKGVKKQLEGMKSRARGGSCEIRTHVHYGSTAYNILEVIREIDASIVVIGTRSGRTGGPGLGATAEEIVRKSPIPLLVVPC